MTHNNGKSQNEKGFIRTIAEGRKQGKKYQCVEF